MYAKKNSGKKIFAVLLAVILLIGGTVGATIAWLQDTTETVTNTFTVGDIDIDLKEHNLNADGTLDRDDEVTSVDTYKILPGTSQPKDPFVRVKAKSEACWVFIKVEEKNNASSYIDYDIDLKTETGGVWTALGTSYPGIYYVDQTATTSDLTLNILKDQKVTYPNTLERDDLEALFTTDDSGNKTVKNSDNLPKLEFTAYAIQKANGDGTFTAEEAWEELDP